MTGIAATSAPAPRPANERASRKVAAIILGILTGLPLASFLARAPELPTSEVISEYFTLERFSAGALADLAEVMIVPFGCVRVVFVRLGLGLRMLGPFRPILIAIGMLGAGIVTGLAFFVFVAVASCSASSPCFCSPH